MKKIVFFLPAAVGGAERVSINYSRLLDEDKFQKVFVLIGKDSKDIRKILPAHARTYEIHINNINRWGIYRIIKILKKEKPDFTFSSMFWVNVRVLVAAKLLGIKAVVRNNNTFDSLQGWMKALVKKTYKFAYKIIVQQEEMYDEVIKKLPQQKVKVNVIHNPFIEEDIDSKRYASNPYPDKDEIKVLWVARFSKQKGQDVLVKAFKLLLENHSNYHLYLLGKYDGGSEFYKQIKMFVAKYCLESKISFCGFDSNPYRWIQNCDCFVMPSRLEGLPNALIEAMYIGKPVVATKCIPVVSRIVKDDYNGILVESEDYIAMSKAIIKALELKNFKMTYKPSTKAEINQIFC